MENCKAHAFHERDGNRTIGSLLFWKFTLSVAFIYEIYNTQWTDSSSGEEPEFAAAIRGFYKDVMKFMGALQFVPSFMAK